MLLIHASRFRSVLGLLLCILGVAAGESQALAKNEMKAALDCYAPLRKGAGGAFDAKGNRLLVLTGLHAGQRGLYVYTNDIPYFAPFPAEVVEAMNQYTRLERELDENTDARLAAAAECRTRADQSFRDAYLAAEQKRAEAESRNSTPDEMDASRELRRLDATLKGKCPDLEQKEKELREVHADKIKQRDAIPFDEAQAKFKLKLPVAGHAPIYVEVALSLAFKSDSSELVFFSDKDFKGGPLGRASTGSLTELDLLDTLDDDSRKPVSTEILKHLTHLLTNPMLQDARNFPTAKAFCAFQNSVVQGCSKVVEPAISAAIEKFAGLGSCGVSQKAAPAKQKQSAH